MIEDFIGVYDDFFNKEECEQTINFMNLYLEQGFGQTRKQFEGIDSHLKSDTSLFATHILEIDATNCYLPFTLFNTKFWNTAYKNYSDAFSVLKDSGSHNIYDLKFQNTKIGGGYHIWHFEADNKKNASRLMAFILYLNDVEEGGETEFLYYPKRVKAKQGRLLLFPSSYTHTHRGNPPISNEKHIVTGWLEY